MIHEPECDCGNFACELRRKNVSVAASATPNRVGNRKQPVVKHAEPPSWEAGRIGHHNKNGTFVPVITERGTHLRVKEYGERRTEIDAILKRKRQGVPVAENP
jgi:hypothetical protein